jgi:acetyl esterase/lipase
MNDAVDNVRHPLAYALALLGAGVPVDMRIYAKGGHVFGMLATRHSSYHAMAWAGGSMAARHLQCPRIKATGARADWHSPTALRSTIRDVRYLVDCRSSRAIRRNAASMLKKLLLALG